MGSSMGGLMMKRFVSSLAVIALLGLSAVTSAAPAEYYYTIGAHCCHEELTDVVMPKIMDSRSFNSILYIGFFVSFFHIMVIFIKCSN